VRFTALFSIRFVLQRPARGLVKSENSLYTGYARTGRGEERQRPRNSPGVAMAGKQLS